MPNEVIHSHGSAHAKTILLGEHAVVYGRPAIAFPVHSLPLTATATWGDSGLHLDTPYHSGRVNDADSATTALERRLPELALTNTLEFLDSDHKNISVVVDGTIPPGRGLGSSAAVAGAIADAVALLHGVALSVTDRFDLVQSVERVAHGTPSGLDAYATSIDSPIWFEQGAIDTLTLSFAPRIIAADTGEIAHTSLAVASVRRLIESQPSRAEQMLDRIAELTVQARGFLERGQSEELGASLTENHEILSELGVSSDRLDRLVATAQTHGALGAKLTGGGQGGCIVALAGSDESLEEICVALRTAGAHNVWTIQQKGLAS